MVLFWGSWASIFHSHACQISIVCKAQCHFASAEKPPTFFFALVRPWRTELSFSLSVSLFRTTDNTCHYLPGISPVFVPFGSRTRGYNVQGRRRPGNSNRGWACILLGTAVCCRCHCHTLPSRLSQSHLTTSHFLGPPQPYPKRFLFRLPSFPCHTLPSFSPPDPPHHLTFVSFFSSSSSSSSFSGIFVHSTTNTHRKRREFAVTIDRGGRSGVSLLNNKDIS